MQQTKAELYKRNFTLLVLEGSLFMAGTGFINSSTVIPVFIDTITHSKQLVGLTLTIGSFFTYFTRLIIGPFIPHMKNHARYSAIVMFICRPMSLLPVFFVFTHHYYGAVIALIVSYAFLWAGDGFIYPAWSEVMANTIDEERHGRMLGLQMLIGGVAAIGSGLMINYFLANPNIDIKTAFGWIFLFGGVLLAASCFMMAFAENAPEPYAPKKVSFREYYKGLPKVFMSEKDNTRMMIVQLLMIVGAMSIPYVILFGNDRLNLPKSASALMILAQTIGTPIGGWFWGQVCDRLGSETGVRLAGVNLILISLLPLIALLPLGVNPLVILLPAMFFCGVNGGIWTCNYIYTVQVVRPESRSSCLVLASLISMPGSFSSYIAGFIADKFGYTALFCICIAIAVAGILLAFTIRPVKVVVAERKLQDEARLKAQQQNAHSTD
jgi:MFS family permease